MVTIFKSPFHVSYIRKHISQSAQFIIQSRVILLGVFAVIFRPPIPIILSLSTVCLLDKRCRPNFVHSLFSKHPYFEYSRYWLHSVGSEYSDYLTGNLKWIYDMKPNTKCSEFGWDLQWWGNEMGMKVYLFRQRNVSHHFSSFPKLQSWPKILGQHYKMSIIL